MHGNGKFYLNKRMNNAKIWKKDENQKKEQGLSQNAYDVYFWHKFEI